DTEREGALAQWKPLGDGLGRTREAAAFSESEREPAGCETGDAVNRPLQRAGERPPGDDDRVAAPCSEAGDQASAADIHHAVGEEKQKLKPAVLLVRDRDVLLQRGDDYGQALAVEVAQGGRQSEQSADPLSKLRDLRGSGHFSWLRAGQAESTTA